MADDKRYWEDFQPGEVLTYGARTIDRERSSNLHAGTIRSRSIPTRRQLRTACSAA
ncbi:MAG: hypothetical protein ACREPL_03090 [Rhodanobacteraceae bacterium]